MICMVKKTLILKKIAQRREDLKYSVCVHIIVSQFVFVCASGFCLWDWFYNSLFCPDLRLTVQITLQFGNLNPAQVLEKCETLALDLLAKVLW